MSCLMSSTIPLPWQCCQYSIIPVPVAGSCKCKQAFLMTDPDNVELAHLATQAAKKKTKLSMVNPSGKESTHQKSPLVQNQTVNCQTPKMLTSSRQETVMMMMRLELPKRRALASQLFYKTRKI